MIYSYLVAPFYQFYVSKSQNSRIIVLANSLINFFGFIGLTQVLLLSVFSLSRFQKSKKINIYIVLLLGVNFAVLLRDLLIYQGYIKSPIVMIYSEYFWSFTTGPLFYFYVKSFIENRQISRKEKWMHFAPMIIVTIIWTVIVIQNYSDLVNVFNSRFSTFSSSILLVIYWHVFPLTYFIISLRKLDNIKESKEYHHIKFIKPILIQFILVNLVSVVTLFLSYFFPAVSEWILPSSFLILCSMGIILSFVIFQYGITSFDKNRVKYASLDIIDSKTLIDNLLKLLSENRIFKNPNLNLTSMARDLNSNTNTLSNAINAHFNMGFNDLINSYRIEYAKKSLLDSETLNYTILAIAEKSGFNSKDSFYRAFKKNCGITPTEFINNHKK